MGWIDQARSLLLTDNDALARYRDSVAALISLPAELLIAAFAMNNVVQGREVMGAITGAVALIFLANHWSIRRRRRPLINYGLILLPGLLGVLAAIRFQGVLGAFWAFPLMLIAYFVIPRFQALVFSFVVLVTVPWAFAAWIDAAVALRLAASLGLTLLFIQVILNVLADLQGQLLQQSRTDALTGVFNRRHLDEVLEVAAAQARRHPAHRALLLLDVDHFKRINDERGHVEGDEALRVLAGLLRQRLRRGDRLFRMGGEEFVVMLDDTRPEEAAQLAESLRQLVESEPVLPDLHMTISVGVSSLRAGEPAQAWLERGDQALYRAKHRGRNRVEVEQGPDA